MAAATDDKLIDDGALDFSQRLHSELPVRHFGEFHDLEQLAKVVKGQKRHAFAKVFDKIWSREREEIVSLFKKLNQRMDREVTPKWVEKNREHEWRSVSFLQKWVDMLCENFNEALEYQLLINPDMETESLKNYVESKKQIITNVFESIWKPGTSLMQQERKSKLEKHLIAKEEETLEKQKHNLESKSAEEGKKLLGDVGAVLLERSRQLKSYVEKHRGRVSNAVLKGIVEEMLEYLLNGKGRSLKETHPEIYRKLVETMEGEVQFLTEDPNKKMTAKEVARYAERFDEKLRPYCIDADAERGGAETQELQEQDFQRRVVLQEILSEFKEERSSEPDDGTHGEANDNHGDDRSHVEEVICGGKDGDKTSVAAGKRISRRRQFAKGGESSLDKVPPLTTAEIAEKTCDIHHHRESATLKKSRKSVQRDAGSIDDNDYFKSPPTVAEKMDDDETGNLEQSCRPNSSSFLPRETRDASVQTPVDLMKAQFLFSMKLNGSEEFFERKEDVSRFYHNHGQPEKHMKMTFTEGYVQHLGYPDNPIGKDKRYYCATCEEQSGNTSSGNKSGKRKRSTFTTKGYKYFEGLWHHADDLGKQYFCRYDPKCQAKFGNARSCISHIRKVHMGCRIKCLSCSGHFPSYDAFTRHFGDNFKRVKGRSGSQSSSKKCPTAPKNESDHC